ncbi:MAG: type II toxin-antitoxin system VapC family toxin [Promethearchaeota archaeon]
MAIFLDSGFYLGLINPKDQFYLRSIELLHDLQSGKFGRIYTSIYVMGETATLVGVRTHNNSIILEGIYNYFSGETQIGLLFRSSKEIEDEAWKLFLKINNDSKKKTVSFVDCSNIIFCRERNIEHILSFDSYFDSWISRIC